SQIPLGSAEPLTARSLVPRSIPPSPEGYRRQLVLPMEGQAAPSPVHPFTHGPVCTIPFSPAFCFPAFFDHEEAPEEKLHQSEQPQPAGSGARHMHAPSSTHKSLHVTATACSAL
uniref:Uncharacterized protein n=1 Tax=Falco tinnunculus TaxID=100819 RepID=A0A8C4TPQ2_FALTI